MGRLYSNIIKGAGSILEIMPPSSTERYARYIPQGSGAKRIHESWQRVGGSLRRALGEYERAQKTK